MITLFTSSDAFERLDYVDNKEIKKKSYKGITDSFKSIKVL